MATQHQNLVGGNIKFVGENLEDILTFAHELQRRNTAGIFKSLSVRNSGFKGDKPVTIIEFLYQLPDNNSGEKGTEGLTHKFTDMAKRRFGNSVMGFSISSPVWMV